MVQLSFNHEHRITSLVEKIHLIVKIARPRTWMFAIVSYLFAYFSGGTIVAWQILLGVTIFALLTGATNLINAFTDIEEDRINNPFRIEWLRHLGVRNLIYAFSVTYSLVIILALPFGPTFTLIIMLAVSDSIFYSLPPIRFKKHPITALLAFSGAVGFPYLAGLTAIDELNLLNPFFILFTLFMFTYGTVKNIPDYVGDKLAGLKTTSTIFNNHRLAIMASSILMLTPYLLLTFFIYTSTLNTVYLLNFALMTFPIYWAYGNLHTDRREIKEKLHTYGFLYSVSFLLFNLILTYPTILSAIITILVHSILYIIAKYSIDSRKETPIQPRYHLEFPFWDIE